jgi:DUF1680 family protein
VRLKIGTKRPAKFKLRLRTPSWATGSVAVQVNGQPAAVGSPGSYVMLDRQWNEGDSVTFRLPMSFRFTRYIGADQVAGRERYALEYGPLLMAFLGMEESELVVRDASAMADVAAKIRPVAGHPLHFNLGRTEIIPYFQIMDEPFSCFPLIATSS